MTKQATNVAHIKRKRPRRARVKSVFELYPMPFFNFDRRAQRRFWAVTPTGDYWADCKTGHHYGIEFLRSCDGTVGWSALVRWILLDIARAGSDDGAWPDGGLKSNGIVIGFLGVISDAVTGFATSPLRDLLIPSIPKQCEIVPFRPSVAAAEVQS
jgi:hypothetical protein